MDIELVDLVAAELGFTYEVRDIAFLDGEGWDDFIHRTMATEQATVHAMLQYWLVKPSRLDAFNIITTHVDVSPVLVARMEDSPEPPFREALVKFMRPCTYRPSSVLRLAEHVGRTLHALRWH